MAERPTAAPAPASASGSLDSRLAELTQKLRANTQRLAERIERAEPPARPAAHGEHPVAEPIARATVAPPPTLPPATAIEDVTLRPIPPKPPLFVEPVDERPPAVPHEEPEHQAAFIPPQAERPPMRPPRMPRVEDLPLPVQKELRASRGEEVDQGHPEKRRTSLLQRLASVGLGRREEEGQDSAPQARAPARPPAPPAQERPPLPQAARPEQRPSESRPPEPVSEYAKRPAAQRPAPQGLDAHGRPAPVLNAFDDDQLEIPAFLRRQAN
jgi:cell division protein FtsZ